MKWLAVLVLGGVAQAAPIQVPAGWTLDASLAPPPAATRFGGATTKVAVYAYRAPVQGAVLYVNRAEAEVAAADRDKLATVEVEEPRNAMRRAGTVKTEQDSQRFDDQAKQLEAIVAWRDASVSDRSRVIIAGDDKRLVSVTGQCVLALDAPAEVVKACDASLATLDAEVPAASRVALAIVHEEPPAPTTRIDHDTISGGDKVALPPIIVEPPKPEADRRPVYVGLGLVVLAAVFWWNRKRREKFEAEHPEEAPRRKRDEDADDLHAAAEAGDSKDKP